MRVERMLGGRAAVRGWSEATMAAMLGWSQATMAANLQRGRR